MALQSSRRASLRAAALLTVLLAVLLATGSGPTGAASTQLIGAGGPADVSCPADCLVEARVTGLQTSVEGSKKPYVAPATGRIVAWSIRLGTPERTDIKVFNRRFGESKARLAVLKPVRRRTGKRRKLYTLLRQSKVERLRPLFGTTPTFNLNRPLKVGEGQVVALTIPTWAPAFSVNQTKLSRWLASRARTAKRGDCFTEGGFANLKAGAPQQKEGTRRAYGCAYRGARLLYRATFVRR